MPRRSRRIYKEPGLAQFRGFREVCRRGGYAAAARALRLTSPAIWEQVRSLEAYFGARLLERDGAGVRPTTRGRRLLEPGPGRAPAGATVYEPAADLDFLLVTPPRHALARASDLRLDDIIRHPLVLGEPGAYSRQCVQEVFRRFQLGERAVVAAETSS